MKSTFLIAAVVMIAATSAHTEDVGCTSTTFRVFGANDKICVYAFDDPLVPGVSCHISHEKAGGGD